ncbi:Hypothetical predicted protein [Prunus dulcis]|uniref:Uncharacterized protein n=1 Tax=Prunus dulcis TaxID=3755 RepID=A0A5E4GCB8_PRUDU|nr:hypothetical protein L3X38_005677 [Prunus dulcis]VVA37407.1 Hypothetical predicted protein [Prunus dulcis]
MLIVEPKRWNSGYHLRVFLERQGWIYRKLSSRLKMFLITFTSLQIDILILTLLCLVWKHGWIREEEEEKEEAVKKQQIKAPKMKKKK